MTRRENRRWLARHLSAYVFHALSDQPDSLRILERELGTLCSNERLILADRGDLFIQGVRNRPGTLYETLQHFPSQDVTYAMFAHSDKPLPGCAETLEIQRLEFTPLDPERVRSSSEEAPEAIHRKIDRISRRHPGGPDRSCRRRLLNLLYRNNPSFVAVSPPERLLSTITLLNEGNRQGGFSLRVDPVSDPRETRLSIAVGNPPGNDLLPQILEVLKRLDIGVDRAYCLTITNGTHPYFVGTFYLRCHRPGCLLTPDSPDADILKREIGSTLLLPTRSPFYREFVLSSGVSEWDASIVAALSSFSASILASADPDRYDEEEVTSAFTAHPSLTLSLVELFRLRFDPGISDRRDCFDKRSEEIRREIDGYGTGHRHLDETRRTVYRIAHSFIIRCLKSNAFVRERQALAFRLDPAIIDDAGGTTTLRLPPARPFRISYFHARNGFGFHIGFSDIARGGWRTLIPRSGDDRRTMGGELFRETFVLAHTQHLKNKDIYEGGAKMVLLLEGGDRRRPAPDDQTISLYRLQYSVANAFLDIFTTRGGVSSHPCVVDYYGEDEPIELGPDENMHDGMIEAIAHLSRRRGYILGGGIISSKRVGINHREYGVTSIGVMTFAQRTLREIGIDLARDRFTVTMTGGPKGDVAGNCIRILLERAPNARFLLIVDGTATIHDPQGIDREELNRLVRQRDLDEFDPSRLGEGGVILYRSRKRVEGFRELHLQMKRERGGLREEWVTPDDFHRINDELLFGTDSDLFIPAGGRPETIGDDSWERFLSPDGAPRARVAIEGANSFFSPRARDGLQRRGMLLMRDSSANKCGVISSSYEIIANLLMSDDEFLARKERYVADVLKILERRALDEAELILSRRRENPGRSMTDISEEISREINSHYERLFTLFTTRQELISRPPFRAAIFAHLPAIVGEEAILRRRVFRLPRKYLCAVLAAEIGASLVYHHDDRCDYEGVITRHARRYLAPSPRSLRVPAPR
ncbi:MAG: NAD-glutamate dehydrogenase [Desulfuromonadia bacterium]